MEFCIRTVVYAQVNTNWTRAGDKKLLGRMSDGDETDHQSTEWSEIRLWLEQLIKLGFWDQARMDFKLLSRILPETDAHNLFLFLTNEAEDRLAATDLESEAYQLSYIHFSFGEFLYRMKDTQNGQNHIVRAREILQPYLSERGLALCYPRISIDIELQLIEHMSVSGVDRISELEKLVEIAQQHGDFEGEKECLEAIFEHSHEHPSKRRLQTQLTRKEEIEGNLCPNIKGQLSTRQKIGEIMGGQQIGSLREWYENHEQQHPVSSSLRNGQPPEFPDDEDFIDVPTVLLRRTAAKVTAMLPLGIVNDIIEATATMNLFKSNINLDAIKHHMQHLSVDGWMQEPGFLSEGALPLCRKLLSRLQDSYRRHTLHPSTLAVIFQKNAFSTQFSVSNLVDGGQIAGDLTLGASLKELTAEDLDRALYPTSPDPRQFLASIRAIQDWLQHDIRFSGRSSSQLLILDLFLSPKLGWSLPQRQALSGNDELLAEQMMLLGKEFLRFLKTCNEDVRKQHPAMRFQIWEIEAGSKNSFRFDEEIDLTELRSRWDDAWQTLEEFKQSPIAQNMPVMKSIYMNIARLEVQLEWQQARSIIFSDYFNKADECLEKLRMGLSALPGTRALEIKSQTSLFHFQNQILIKQIMVSLFNGINRLELLGGTGNMDSLLGDLWAWVQKSKARAIGDLLGLNAAVLEQLEQRLSLSPTNRIQLKRWMGMRKELSRRQSLNHPTLDIEQEIQDLENQENTSPELKEVFSLSRGRAVGMEDMNRLLDAMPPEQRSKVVLIDWFVGKRPDTFDMIVYQHGAAPKLFELEDALQVRVQEWVEKYPGAEDQRFLDSTAAWTEAQQLRALIQPIGEVTEADDILVLSPTGILHRFPLHALQVCQSREKRRCRRQEDEGDQSENNEISLLERNLLVFVPSMSLFRFCCLARMDPHSQETFKAIIAAPIQQITQAVDEMSEFLGCNEQNDLQGTQVTKNALVSRCEGADFLHFYGHVHNRDAANPMDAHLLLTPRSEDGRDDEICTGAHEEGSWLKASDILASVSFRTGAHVNLIACHSGVNYAALGDDILGLIPALLMGGARSVCSTLWAVDEKPADEWTAQLTYEWETARSSRVKATQQTTATTRAPAATKIDQMINLAQCVRKASLSLMDSPNHRAVRMRHWAPYVYHGFWAIPDWLP